jgi:hypothetical protein
MEYTRGLIAAIAGLGLYSYSVRELLASLALLTMAFFLLGAVALGALLIWSASEKVAIRTALASHKMIALSRRFIIAYTKP